MRGQPHEDMGEEALRGTSPAQAWTSDFQSLGWPTLESVFLLHGLWYWHWRWDFKSLREIQRGILSLKDEQGPKQPLYF